MTTIHYHALFECLSYSLYLIVISWLYFTDAKQCLEVMHPQMELPEMDGIALESISGKQEKGMEVSHHLSQELRDSFVQGQLKEELPQDVHPYLGKLEQEECLVCPDSIHQSEEKVDGLILCQTMEQEAIDTKALMGESARNPVQAIGIPFSTEDASVGLSDQVDEISEGQVAHDSFVDVPLVHPCTEIARKAVKQLDAKSKEVELESIYSDYAQCCPANSISSPTVASKSEESSTKNSGGVKTEVSVYRNNSTVEELILLPCKSSCKNSTLPFSFEQSETKMAPTLPVNRIDTKSSDLIFFLLPDIYDGKKTQQHKLPIKAGKKKSLAVEDVCPNSSEVRHGKCFLSTIKSESVMTKAEQLDYAAKPELLDTKPEVSLSKKHKSLDSKPEVLQCATSSDGTEIQPETKPEALKFTSYQDGAKLKTDINCDVEYMTYPDSSQIKSEVKPEGPEFRTLPKIKAKTRQELSEADSTVLTPKLEKTDRLEDTAGSLVVKGPVKEERTSTPGKSFFQRCNIYIK